MDAPGLGWMPAVVVKTGFPWMPLPGKAGEECIGESVLEEDESVDRVSTATGDSLGPPWEAARVLRDEESTGTASATELREEESTGAASDKATGPTSVAVSVFVDEEGVDTESAKTAEGWASIVDAA
jgi:hypothetical protein